MKMLQNQKGLSLLELLVVIAIIGIMSVLTIPQYSKYKDSKSLGLTKTQIVNDVRTVQNYTFTTLKFIDGDFPKGGYGMYFSTDSTAGANTRYIIFADKGDPPNQVYDSGEKFEEVTLPSGVKITGLYVGAAGTPQNYVNFVSVPPYGTVSIKDSVGNTDRLKIEYKNASGVIGYVFLERSGSIN